MRFSLRVFLQFAAISLMSSLSLATPTCLQQELIDMIIYDETIGQQEEAFSHLFDANGGSRLCTTLCMVHTLEATRRSQRAFSPFKSLVDEELEVVRYFKKQDIPVHEGASLEQIEQGLAAFAKKENLPIQTRLRSGRPSGLSLSDLTHRPDEASIVIIGAAQVRTVDGVRKVTTRHAFVVLDTFEHEGVIHIHLYDPEIPKKIVTFKVVPWKDALGLLPASVAQSLKAQMPSTVVLSPVQPIDLDYLHPDDHWFATASLKVGNP